VKKFKHYLVDDEDAIDGTALQNRQQELGVYAQEISRLTGMSRASIYRAYRNEASKAHRLLIKLALEYPYIFEGSSEKFDHDVTF